MGNKSLIVVGLLGGLTGVLVASIGGTSDAPPLPPAQSPIPETSISIPKEPQQAPTKSESKPSVDVVDVLKDAHGRLNDAERGSTARLTDGFKKLLRSEKSYRPILEDYFRRVGQGTLVSNGSFTDAGKAVIAYAGTVSDHGLPTKNYPVEKVRTLVNGLKPDASTTPKQSHQDARLKAVQGLLLAPEFDPTKASRTLQALRPPLTPEDVEDMEQRLKNTSLVKPVSSTEMKAELATARLLMNLVLDFKIFRRAGPFRPLTNKSEAFALYKNRPKKAVGLMVDITMAEEPSQAMTLLEPTRPEYQSLVIHRQYRAYAKKGCHRLLNEMRLQLGKKGSEVRALRTPRLRFVQGSHQWCLRRSRKVGRHHVSKASFVK